MFRRGRCLRALRECRSPAQLMFRWDQCYSTADVFLFFFCKKMFCVKKWFWGKKNFPVKNIVWGSIGEKNFRWKFLTKKIFFDQNFFSTKNPPKNVFGFFCRKWNFFFWFFGQKIFLRARAKKTFFWFFGQKWKKNFLFFGQKFFYAHAHARTTHARARMRDFGEKKFGAS